MAAKIHDSVDQLIGGTPLLELKRLEKSEGLAARLLVKLEARNPGGSVKDRVAKSMLDQAENSGALAPGGVIIEPTSGNTGIGLATVAAARGYRLIVTMPENMSRERQAPLRARAACRWTALRAATLKKNAGKIIAALLPDTGERYLSTDLFTEEQ